MQDRNASRLLAKVMNWQEQDAVLQSVPQLQLLAEHKYDRYQRFGPGRKFIESLALWINRFESEDRDAALALVAHHLVFFSDAELSHIVQTAYPDWIVRERMRLVAEEHGIPAHRVAKIAAHPRFEELKLKSLYLGLSDGARTNELRRASDGDIGNEQIWQAYELGEQKSGDMLEKLKEAVAPSGTGGVIPRFNLIWLLDDFSGSGNTYIRYDAQKSSFKGKLPKIYAQLYDEKLVDPSHYEVFLLLYVATRQAIDHIEYWCERFTSEQGYKPLQLRVLCILESSVSLTETSDAKVADLLKKTQYFDQKISHDKHIRVGGSDGRMGFANCALPFVLAHNTPNNSIYVLWGPEGSNFEGLFPRVSRHREA
jgi:hypothetical protein